MRGKWNNQLEDNNLTEHLSIMKAFLLLLLPLMTGCVDTSRVKGCTDGWVEFICEYPDTDETYTSVAVVKGKHTLIESTKENVWVNNGKYSVYNDKRKNNVTVAIRQLQTQDFGEYNCVFKSDSSEEDMERRVKLKLEKNECQEPFTQTAYKTAKTTISCPYEGKSKVKFFCRLNGSICEDIVSTRSLRSNGTFNLTESNRSFSMSISDVSPQHAGVYWCGVERSRGRYRAALRKITLEVEVPPTVPPVPSVPSVPPITSSASPHPVTFSVSSTQSTTASAGSSGGGESWVTIVVAVVVSVAFLVLLIILVLSYKRFQRSKNTKIGELPNNEDRAYEEIQVPPQKPGAGTALQTIYVTASAPTIPSVPQYYSTVNFHSSSSEASGDTYSTVKEHDQSPAYSTVNHPSSLPEDPFYSTVNKPQQH